MIKYWPEKPSIELNSAVVELFIETQRKLNYTLYNQTNYRLYIDILDDFHKYQIINIILKELEGLVLEITELNLTIDNLKNIKLDLLSSFTHQCLTIFLYEINITNDENLQTLFTNETRIYHYTNIDSLIETLLIYLIFGSSNIDNAIFVFNKNKTPYNHVNILFENFIIQTSNLITYKIFNQIKYLPHIVLFLKKYNLCNNTYASIRSIALLLNELTLQNFIQNYINKPKTLYNSRIQVWMFSPKGLISKYIYAFRIENINKISKKNYFILCFLEILDITIPKLEKFFIAIGKYFIYITINFLGNILLLVIRSLIKYVKK
uniref:Uncharacterized protein n=1 Tax=Anotrichium furcellatum TaxID=41999 RepID=A0A4D6WNU9_9FLOR|nr:hypothetical protein [Anotrichium furcellatum]